MTRRDGLIPTCIISLLCVTPSTALEADTVHLKNGRRMTGKVVKQTTERIVLDVGMGTVTLRMAEVASIAHDDFSSVEPHRQSRAALAAHSDWDEIPPGRTPVSIPGGVDDEASRMQERVFVAPEETPSFLAKDPSSVQSAEALPRLADELLPVVAQLRGLTPHALITKRIASQATIRQIISQILARQRPDEEVANKGKTLIAFGLLPSSAHLQDILMRLYTQQAAGLYDPSTKVLYLADWIPAPLQAGTVAHELVHALQDQHFDLVRYFDEVKDDSEATTARHAVIEGEATAVMLAFQLRDVGDRGTELGELAQWTGSMAEVMAQQDPSLAAMPAFLKDSALFPYLSGMRFIQAVRARYSWSEMGALYRDPPRSTEQILHPDKYLSQRDDPIPVRLADLRASLGPSWKRIDEDVLGEFAIQCLLRQAVEEEAASLAASGWGGDRYALYEEAATRRLVLVWRSVWDSTDDAQQFADAYQHALVSQCPDAAPVPGQEYEWRTAEERMRVERRGTEVVFVKGPRALALDRLSQQLWRSSVRDSR